MAHQTLDLSPSLVHQKILRKTKPALAYDGGDVRAWQTTARRKLKQLVGWSNFAHGKDRCALKPRTLWKRDSKLGTIEKVVFTAEAGADVVGYWCVPHDLQPPYRTFICLQGHSSGMHNSIALDADERAPIQPAGDRDFCINTMRAGHAALAIEQRGFGQRSEKHMTGVRPHHLTCNEASMVAISLGRTLLAERVFDVDRAIDYLAQRGDVDTKRIGIMGNSGGGTISLFGAALLPRLAYAMPSCYFCTFAASILSLHHCVCNFVPNLPNHFEMDDVAGLIAPRPLVLVNGKTDDIFPIAAARKAFRRLKKIYTAADAANNVRHVVGPEGHRFYADLSWPVMNQLIDKP